MSRVRNRDTAPEMALRSDYTAVACASAWIVYRPGGEIARRPGPRAGEGRRLCRRLLLASLREHRATAEDQRRFLEAQADPQPET